MTPEEMQAKVEALRGVNTIEDWYEERGHMPSMDEQIEEDRDRWYDSMSDRAIVNEANDDVAQIIAEEARRDREDQDRADAFSLAQDMPPVASTPVPDGKYTVVMEDGEYRTFMIRTQPATASFCPGRRILKVLTSADNMDERSYVGF